MCMSSLSHIQTHTASLPVNPKNSFLTDISICSAFSCALLSSSNSLRRLISSSDDLDMFALSFSSSCLASSSSWARALFSNCSCEIVSQLVWSSASRLCILLFASSSLDWRVLLVDRTSANYVAGEEFVSQIHWKTTTPKTSCILTLVTWPLEWSDAWLRSFWISLSI